MEVRVLTAEKFGPDLSGDFLLPTSDCLSQDHPELRLFWTQVEELYQDVMK